MKKLFLILSVLTINISCSSKNINTGNDSSLEKESYENSRLYDIWGLKEINGEPLAINKAIVLELNTKLMNFQGNAGCNTISGVLKLEQNNAISLENTRSTRMACPNLSAEQIYLKTLDKVAFYEIKNLHLILLDENNQVLLDYIKMD